MKKLLAAAVLLAALAAFAVAMAAAETAYETSEPIAFTRDKAVYVMGTDGTGVRLLWQGTRRVLDLAWSLDGRKLAFSTSGRSVWVMNADGSDRVRVARVEARSLSWSPDGRRIAFTRRYKSDDPDIWVMDATGSHMRRLARTPTVWDSNVDWKPTGGWLAFDSGGWVPFVYEMRTNGRNLRKLPPPPMLRGWPDSTNPDWSPDGRRIVFASVAGSDSIEIWVMSASGKQWVQLTKNRVHDSSPVWSPDGRRIAFVRGNPDPDSWEIYVMKADGSGARKLTKGASPAWQPLAHRVPPATDRS